MRGHNKFSKIKRLKAKNDAQKSKVFSKMVKLISVASRKSKGDINSPELRSAIEKERAIDKPNDSIERAVKKASEPGTQMELITYEAYGPGGVGIIIETLTDSKNRTVQDIKHILSKNGFTLADVGSVVWSFVKEKTLEGIIWKPNMFIPVSDADLELLDKLVDELEENDDVQDVYTNAE